MGETSNVVNMVPLKKRRRALTSPAALQFLRETGGESGIVEVASRAELAVILGWERTRASKALKAWERAGKVTTNIDADTGKIAIRVMPDRREMERENAPGISREKRGESSREKRPREMRESVQNSNAASNTYLFTNFDAQTLQNAPAQTQILPSQSTHSDREISRSFSRFRWRRGSGNGSGNFPGANRRPLTPIDAAAWLVAVALAGVAAYFSVSGMVVLFPGAPTGAMTMGITMEVAKLVTAGWLGGHWRVFHWLQRIALGGFVLGLMSINAVGLYSRLVSAHVGHLSEITASNETNDARTAAQIEVQEARLADIKERLAQLDETVEGAAKKGKANTATNIRQEQKKERARLADEREAAAKELAHLKTARAESMARGHAAESEAAPIQYIAQLFRINAGGEQVIRWLIAAMVLCCDPLAVVIMMTWEGLRRSRKA